MSSHERRFFEFCLTNLDPRNILRDSLATDDTSVINTLNAHSFNVTLRDEEFRQALLASDWLVADGIGVVWAARAQGTRELGKISGYDLFVAAMTIADQENLTVGFLGSTDEVLEKIRHRATVDYPGAGIQTYSPPFAPRFTQEQSQNMIDDLGPVDILCVGMTAPKQEKWVEQSRGLIKARAVLSIGAVFDFYAGTTKRAHPLFIKLGLEWLGRSLADPKRLGKRNLVAIPTFVFNCVRESLSHDKN